MTGRDNGTGRSVQSRPTLRFGVFYDGGWFSGLWRYLADHSAWRAAPTFLGVHDALRWYLYRELDHPLPSITRVCAHYVLGRPAPGEPSAQGNWETVLARFGIVRHDARHANGHEQDADEMLGRVALSQASRHALDVVALITGDLDLRPAARQLVDSGVAVIVPSLPPITYSEEGSERSICTSARLVETATCTPGWLDLLGDALDPAYPLSYPFTSPVPGAVSKPAPDGYRYGTVNRWDRHQPHGFVTDRGGRDWFVDRTAIPGNPRWKLGQPVRFTGGLPLTPGRKYPQVRSIRPYEPHGLIPSKGHHGR